jgi:hypothetical protein
VSGSGTAHEARKYEDGELERHGLMADDWRMRSSSHEAFDAARFLEHQQSFPNGSTRLHPLHKDARAAQRIVEATADRSAKAATAAAAAAARGFEEAKEQSDSDNGFGSSNSSFSRSLGSPLPSAAVPSLGRPRQPSPLYGTSYGDSIGAGLRPSAQRPIHPRYPNDPVTFPPAREGESLPALDGTLNKSLAQAIASLPAADNILKGNVSLHGSYSRDYGHRGHHPLQRNAGLVGGPPVIHAGSMTSGSSPSFYPTSWRPATHHHNFPSPSLIGPSGAKVGPHPIEGINHYPHTSYDVSAFPAPQQQAQQQGGNGNAAFSKTAPPTRTNSASAVGTGFSLNLPVAPSVSDMGTTKELFAGSTKASGVRIPGYQGFIPASAANALAIQGGPPHGTGPSAKDHILTTFSHDMPGYSGHQPRCVVNVRGPRTPRGKKRLNEGLVASLILDSMKI